MQNVTTNETINVAEDPELNKLINEFDSVFEEGLNETQKAFANLTTTSDLEEAKTNLVSLKHRLLNEFEITVNSLKDAAEKDYTVIQEKLLFSKELSEEDKYKLERSKLIIDNIKELENNDLLINFVDSNNSELFTNMYKAKLLENKFIHKLRSAKIKKENVEGNYELINNIKIPELKEKCMYFYNAILNTYMNEKLEYYKVYIVLIMGMLRLTIRTTHTFKTMEEIYYSLKNLPIPEGLLD